MATAEQVVIQAAEPMRVVEIPARAAIVQYTIDLTSEEADDIVGVIGRSPYENHQIMAGIYTALRKAGVPSPFKA